MASEDALSDKRTLMSMSVCLIYIYYFKNIMNFFFLQIAESGIEFSKISKEKISEFSDEGKLRSPTTSSAKKRKIDSVTRTEFEIELKKIMEWFDKTESSLQLLIDDDVSPQDQFTEEEQLVLVQVKFALIYCITILGHV